MGKFWLQDIDTVLQPGVGNGIPGIEEVSGWMTRSRSSGGLDSINGILDHHTASPPSWDWARDIEYIAFTNPYRPSPISQLYVGRTGWVAIIAAGAANHGGRGGAYKPGGPTYVQIDKANQTLIGKEMGNSGTGEQWPWEQIESSITIDALICLAEGWDPGHVFAHKEYCGPGTSTPGRKIDPFGPWENHPSGFWVPGSSWGSGQSNINYYRSLVQRKMNELSQELNSMKGFIERPAGLQPRILDTRGPTPETRDSYKLNGGHESTNMVPGGAGKSHAIANLTIAYPEGHGYVTVWASGPRPESSVINYRQHVTIANEITIPLAADGTFKIWSSARTHVVVDLVGYYKEID